MTQRPDPTSRRARKRRPELHRLLEAASTVARPSPRRARGWILHGARCSGKSYVVERAKEMYPQLPCIEMDHSRYWRQPVPEALQNGFEEWFEAWLREGHPSRDALREDIESAEPANRLVRIILIKACEEGRGFVASRGNLPLPREGRRFYAALEDLFRIELEHVLLAPRRKTLAARIEARGLFEMEEKILRRNRVLLGLRESFHRVVRSEAESDALLSAIGDSVSPV